jgi:DinB superfamily
LDETLAMTSPALTPGAARPASLQDALHAHLLRDLSALDLSLRQLVESLTDGQRRTVPITGGWHVDAVCEHLCLGNEFYLRAMSAALDAALRAAPSGPQGAKGATGTTSEPGTSPDMRPVPRRPTIAGRLLVHALVSPRRMPRPAVLTPGPEPRAHVLESLIASHDALRTVLQRAAGVEWRRVRFSSPFARIVRLNLGDGALVIVRHGERHARQIARIRASILS